MTIQRVGAQASLLALMAMLAGCGGGDSVNSTPTPTPTPTVTPTPSPTPTPTPTASVNDDLIPPLSTESFANNAHRASASYSSSGALSNESQGSQTLTVSYDAATGSYTLSAPGRSQTFGTADRVNGGYRRTSGAVTDDLTLTPAGPTAQPLTYRYVGAGFWQRQTQTNGGGIDGSIDAFVYGVPTATLVRTGTAYYSFDLLGAVNGNGSQGPNSLRGSGTLSADLAAGTIRGGADFLLYRPDGTRFSNGTYDGVFSTSATISSTGNGFSGTAQLLAFGNFQGTLAGRFFGPGAAEIGASFSAVDASGHVAVGALVGRNDPSLALAGLANLTARTTFRGAFAGLSAASYYLNVLTIDPATGTYEVPADVAGAPGALTIGSAQKLANQPDARFTDYAISQNGQDVTFRAYRVGPANSELALTYTSFALLSFRPTGTGDTPDLRAILYGVHTAASAVPRAGSANYAGVIYGAARDQSDARYTMSGTSSFAVDFTNLRVNGNLHPILTKVTDGSIIDYGSVAMTPAILDRTSYIGFNGVLGGDGSQSISAFFFGPQAEEIGATFNLRRYDGTNSLTLAGVTVAKGQ